MTYCKEIDELILVCVGIEQEVTKVHVQRQIMAANCQMDIETKFTTSTSSPFIDLYRLRYAQVIQKRYLVLCGQGPLLAMDLTNHQWHKVKFAPGSMVPCVNKLASAVEINGGIVIFSAHRVEGAGVGDKPISWIFSYSTMSWSQLETRGEYLKDYESYAAASSNYVSASGNSICYFFGGKFVSKPPLPTYPPKITRNVLMLKPETGWCQSLTDLDHEKGDHLPLRKINSSCAILGENMYVFGGLDTKHYRFIDELHSFNLRTKQWSRVTKESGFKWRKVDSTSSSTAEAVPSTEEEDDDWPVQRQGAILVSDGHQLYLFGGHSSLFKRTDLWILPIKPNTASLMQDKMNSTRLNNSSLADVVLSFV